MAKSGSRKLMVVCAVAAAMMVGAAMADVGDAAATCKANVGGLVTQCYPAVVAKYRRPPTASCCKEVKAFLPCFCKSKHVSQPDSLGSAAAGFVKRVANLIKNKFTKPRDPSREIPKVSLPAIKELPAKCGLRCRS